jgi:putative nucleotidyltransferase with HDIG domain
MKEEYFPVPLKRIVVDSIPDFSLYIKRKDIFVLYRAANYAFQQENLQNLIRNNVDSVYVAKKDLKLYEGYRLRMRSVQEVKNQSAGFEGRYLDQEEVERHYSIIDNFHVAEAHLFETGMEIGFPIFYLMDNDIRQFEEIESRPEGPWEVTANIRACKYPLMIRKEDIPAFRAFVEKMMTGSTGGEKGGRKQVQHQAIVLREMSKMVVQDVLDDPRSGEKIKNLNQSVHGLVDFILDNETSYYSLMRISAHDFYTYVHSINVCTFCVGLGSAIGLSRGKELEQLGLGAMLHDVGKSQVDPRLINKPGRLTDEEFKQMRNHVTLGVDLLNKHHKLPAQVLEPVAQHHEKISGVGYPLGLKGGQLSLFGRISSIVDIYDALTTKRSYKTAFTPFEALSFLSKTEADYDKNLLKEFVLTLGKQIEQEKKVS